MAEKPTNQWTSTVTTSVAFRVGRHKVALQLRDPLRSPRVQVFADGAAKSLPSKRSLKAGPIRVQAHSHTRLSLENRQTQTRVAVRIHKHKDGYYMSVRVRVDGYWNKPPKFTSGLCGTYDKTNTNDLALPNGKAAPNLPQFFKAWSVTKKHSLMSVFHHYAQQKVMSFSDTDSS